MAVTIDDIAKKAGVSSATISRVLNNSSYVKEETKERVLKVIEEMNYVPSAIARSLSKRETNTIGIIVPDITNSYFGEIIKGISKIAEEVNLNIILFNTNNDVKSELKALDEVKKHRLKGVIMTPGFGDTKLEDVFIDIINSINIPIVLVSADLNYINLNGVFVDDVKGGFDATKLLINEGHEKIGIITGIISSSSAMNRLNGYKEALIQSNIPIIDDYIKEGQFSLDRAYEITKEFLDMENPPTAIISCSNRMTLGTIKALFEREKNIPRDMALVGFNKIDLIDIVGINLTYIEDSPMELGVSAIKLLLEIFKNKDNKKINRINIPPKLILNGSEEKVNK
ncbi:MULTISPECIES: LacI family DNA-binding transcriptional regulator [Clostridium]|jgi:LacI family transcriptional regulator|uniref:LacI family DNA-binding transcriptional regulator n=1 Tax=Clostridium TaxID=1485 RepID=UPI00062E6756|nr:LacI family DNA-binding transcriptional regulator [Clostridium sp. C8]KLE17083.1 LacI family transcriptional regulator [Clostridium sp. C8]